MFLIILLSCLHKMPLMNVMVPPIPLYRSTENGERLYVEADLGSGGPYYFLVDTGASISAIRPDIVQSMGLNAKRKDGYLQGVSGVSPWIEATVPSVAIGNQKFRQVDFAVGVSGIPEYAGLVPIAGVIGNNVWQEFIVEIDYGKETLRLHNEFEMPESSQSVAFNGQHILAEAKLWYDETSVQTLIVNVDTGSSGLIINASDAPQLVEDAQSAKSAIMGVGATSNNRNNYVIDTLQSDIQQIQLGGLTQQGNYSATLIPTQANRGFISLVGYSVLEGNRLLIDYQGKKLSIEKSDSDRKPNNLHAQYLEELLWSAQEEDLLEIINLHMFLEQEQIALRKLEKAHNSSKEVRYTIALADYHFQNGDIENAIKILGVLSSETLIETNRLGILLLAYTQTNKMDMAKSMGLKLVEEYPDNPENWLALSDIFMLSGEYNKSKEALYQARMLLHPDAFNVRRAILAYKIGDVTAAISHLRNDIRLSPLGSHSLWFAAMASKSTEFESLILQSLDDAKPLINSSRGALDFLAAAYWELGHSELAIQIANVGKDRDCIQTEADLQTNCIAWYDSLIHENVEAHLSTMEDVVERNPGRSDYMDTLAVLYRANGKKEQANVLAQRAMLLSGADPYMLWQALY
jgi:tetratricopeptide (TPR) repeat protein